MTRILEVGVKAVIHNKSGLILALLRSKPFYEESLCRWDIPGGRINAGEKLEQALRREIFEETGLKMKGIEKILSVQDILRNPQKHTVRVTYLVYCNEKQIRLNPNEHSDYKWVSLIQFQKIKHDFYLTPILKTLKLDL